jgi:hypothetical protein
MSSSLQQRAQGYANADRRLDRCTGDAGIDHRSTAAAHASGEPQPQIERAAAAP